MNKIEKTKILKSLSCIGGILEISVGSENYNVLVEFHKLNNSNEEFYNATSIVKQYNNNCINENRLKKRLFDFIKSRRFKELIKILNTKFSYKENQLYFKSGSGNKSKTFIHKDLFLSLMIWLDPKYELAITDFIRQVSLEHQTVTNTRKTEIEQHQLMTDSLKMFYDEILRPEGVKQTEQQFYITIQSKIRKKATGRTKKKGSTHDELSAREIAIITTIRALIPEWIDSSISNTKGGREARKYLYSLIEEMKPLVVKIKDIEV